MKLIIKIFLSVVLVVQGIKIFADTLTVKQDSTGDYQMIQPAINAANNGDVVLVYPGIYYENVNFNGKSINLFSTYALTPSDSLVRLTVIDGHQNGSCVTVENVTNGSIKGFTLQNGSGHVFPSKSTTGGGIEINYSTVSVAHCIIKNNSSSYGGGITISFSNAILSGNNINNNHAYSYGGGINIGNNSNVVFDQNDLNSVYLNYASIGYDIIKVDPDNVNHIMLDTATVEYPDHYYFSSVSPFAYQTGHISYENLHWKIEQVQADLYVSPVGNNSNTGLTPDNPLQTIAFALLKIKPDSTQPYTIHLAAGVYSDSLNGEKLALGLKSYLTINGSGIDSTYIDGEHAFHFAALGPGEKTAVLKNFSFINGNGRLTGNLFGGLRADRLHKIVLDSVGFVNCKAKRCPTTFVGANDTTIIKNCRFIHNIGEQSTVLGALTDKPDYYFKIINSEFAYTSNTWPFDFDTTIKVAIPIAISGQEQLINGNGKIHGDIIGCLFDNNTDSAGNATLPTNTGVGMIEHVSVNFINNTFVDNHSDANYGSPLGIGGDSKATVYNCLFYNNMPYNIDLVNNLADKADTLYVYNSCIKNGINGIEDLGQFNYLYYDSSNFDLNPQFLGGDEYPYNLLDGSPCIDAGTLNLPAGIVLPETDIAGNPRIFNGKIDIGAYEWNTMVGFRNNPAPIQKKHLLNISPNPFHSYCKITIKGSGKGLLEVNIFTQQGLLIKHLENTSLNIYSSHIIWSGKDDNGNSLPSGVYIVSLSLNERELETQKVVKK